MNLIKEQKPKHGTPQKAGTNDNNNNNNYADFKTNVFCTMKNSRCADAKRV